MAHRIWSMVGGMTPNTRLLVITTEHVSRVMDILLDKAKKVMNVTPQKGFHTGVYSIHNGGMLYHI